ncbi:hypothetical protein D8S78_16015 [Natrialba swarupiae]|nr:hypothetical protein [Natrialba swarupiae]
MVDFRISIVNYLASGTIIILVTNADSTTVTICKGVCVVSNGRLVRLKISRQFNIGFLILRNTLFNCNNKIIVVRYDNRCRIICRISTEINDDLVIA